MFTTVCEKFSLPKTVTKEGVLAMATAREDYDKAWSTVEDTIRLYTGMYSMMSDEEKRKLSDAQSFLERFEHGKVKEKINSYIDNVINKDKGYFGKLSSFGISCDLLRYCF